MRRIYTKLAQLKKLFSARMKILQQVLHLGETAFMQRRPRFTSFQAGISHFLTPRVFKQAHHVWKPDYQPPRWSLSAVVWTLFSMTFLRGDSQEEVFVTAQAAYVAAHPKLRRPGKTLAGFLMALAKIPLIVFRALAEGVRRQFDTQFVSSTRINGLLPLACDGTRLECPRAEQLQQRLGQAGKPESCR